MKFRMVDRIVDWQPRRRITGVKAVSFEEYSLRSPWGGPPALPESLVMECLFQLGNWLIILSSGFAQMGLLVRSEEVRFDDRLRPGESLRMEVDVVSYHADGMLFNGRGLVGNRLISAGRGCLATLVPLEDYQNPDDLRVLFSEIYRPATVAAE